LGSDRGEPHAIPNVAHTATAAQRIVKMALVLDTIIIPSCPKDHRENPGAWGHWF